MSENKKVGRVSTNVENLRAKFENWQIKKKSNPENSAIEEEQDRADHTSTTSINNIPNQQNNAFVKQRNLYQNTIFMREISRKIAAEYTAARRDQTEYQNETDDVKSDENETGGSSATSFDQESIHSEESHYSTEELKSSTDFIHNKQNLSSDTDSDYEQNNKYDNEALMQCLEFPEEDKDQKEPKAAERRPTFPKRSASNIEMLRKTFKRQESSINEEFLFEVSMVIYLALNLSNKKFADYVISTKDQKYGALGNIILKLKLSSGSKQKYVIRLKNLRENTHLSMNNFFKSESDFNLAEYCEQYHSLPLNDSIPLKYIVCTNCFLQDNEELETEIQDENDVITVKLIKCLLELEALNFEQINGKTCQSFKFQIIENKSKCTSHKFQKYSTFFENFVLITKFLEVDELDEKNEHSFKSYSRSNNPYLQFFKYVETWNSKEGTVVKLSKSVVTEVIALILLSPYITAFPEKNPENEELLKNEILFKQATCQFNVTVIKQKHADKVKRLWSNVCDELPDMKTLNTKLANYQFLFNIGNNLSDEEMTKALWLLRKCPLIVDNCRDVIRAITLCQQTDLSFILLNDNDSEYDYWMHVFTTLSDLKEKSFHLYENIIQNFVYFLQGQQMSLQTLIHLSKYDLTKIITPNELICLTDESVHFQEKNFLSLYITRVLPKIVINAQFVNTVDDDTVIFITSCDKNSTIKNRLNEFDVQNINLNNTNEKIADAKIFLVEEEPTGLNQLTILAGEKKFHWFRYLDDLQFEWVKSQVDDINVLQKYQNILTSECIDEKLLVQYESENNINILCGDSGVGKTSLMKNMKKSRLPKWTAFINTKKFFQHFRDNKNGDVNEFKNFFLKETCKNVTLFEKQLVHTFSEKKLVRYIWDELDNLPEDILTTVLIIIDKLHKEEAKQWLICQNDLRFELQRRYCVFARTIRMFGQQDQDVYFQDRLKMSSSDIQKQQWNHSFLSVPLHIFVFTELLRQDKNTYSSLLSARITEADLYTLFVDYNLSKLSEYSSKKERLNSYEKLAAYLYFGEHVSKKLCYEVTEFLEQIQTEGDECGIINVQENVTAEFVYGYVGEYLAVSFLVKNIELSVQVKNYLFRDGNIRYLFDAMVSAESKAHQAVILKDFDLLKSCTEEELKVKDNFGRHALHYACAYGKQYSHLPVENVKNVFVVDDTFMHFQDITPESDTFREILKYLLEKVDVYESDDFGEDCLSYADMNNCFYALAVLTKAFQTYFKHDSKTYVNVLYYSVRFDYHEVFESSQNILFVQSKQFNKSLLHLAVVFNSYKCLEKIISNSENFLYVDIVQQNTEKLLKLACKSNKNEIVKVFLENGSQIKQIYEDDDDSN